MKNKEKYLEAGKIVNTHGVRGDIKVDSYCDSVEDLLSFSRVFIKNGTDYKPYKITKASAFKGMALLHFEGIDDFDAANLLKNKLIYASRDDMDLPEGTYFVADLIGLPVFDAASGRVYGKVKDLVDGSASRLYEIETPSGVVLLPAVDAFISGVDLEKGIAVTPIEGFFDEI